MDDKLKFGPLCPISWFRSRFRCVLGNRPWTASALDPVAWVLCGSMVGVAACMIVGERTYRLLVPNDFLEIEADFPDGLSIFEKTTQAYGPIRGSVAAVGLYVGGVLFFGPYLFWIFLVPRRTWYQDWLKRVSVSKSPDPTAS